MGNAIDRVQTRIRHIQSLIGEPPASNMEFGRQLEYAARSRGDGWGDGATGRPYLCRENAKGAKPRNGREAGRPVSLAPFAFSPVSHFRDEATGSLSPGRPSPKASHQLLARSTAADLGPLIE